MLDGDPAHPPLKGHSLPEFSVNIRCGQTAGWTKMPLGTEGNVGSGDVVLDAVVVAPPSPYKGHSPQFSVHVYCGQTAGWMKTPHGTEVELGPGHIVLEGEGPSFPAKGAQQPPSFRPMSIVATVAHLRYC